MRIVRTAALLTALLASSAALAHPGHGAEGAAAGFLHPFSGLDHLLAMIAIGAWAAQQSGRARWAVPGAFIAFMALGALAGNAGFAIPLAEPLIVASLLVLGLAIATQMRAHLAVGISIATLFALMHGSVHGAESGGAPMAAYIIGMLAATATLHGAGFAAGATLRAVYLRLCGVAIAAGGVALAVAGA